MHAIQHQNSRRVKETTLDLCFSFVIGWKNWKFNARNMPKRWTGVETSLDNTVHPNVDALGQET